MSIFFERLEEIVAIGEPLFNSEDIIDGIKALPDALTFLNAAVKVLNNSVIEKILSKCFRQS